MLALAMRSPELELTDSEANAMAIATANVARHYPHTVDPKAVDIAILCAVILGAYVPRIHNIRARRRAERATNVTDPANPPPPPFMPTGEPAPHAAPGPSHGPAEPMPEDWLTRLRPGRVEGP